MLIRKQHRQTVSSVRSIGYTARRKNFIKEIEEYYSLVAVVVLGLSPALTSNKILRLLLPVYKSVIKKKAQFEYRKCLAD